jgi:hypothetical protein
MTRSAGCGSFARVATIGGMQLAFACISSKRPGYQPWTNHEDRSESLGAGIV